MFKVLVGINVNDTVYDKIYDEENIDTLNFDFYVGYDYILDSYYIHFSEKIKFNGNFVHKCYVTFNEYFTRKGFNCVTSEFVTKKRVLEKLCVDGMNVNTMFDRLEDVWITLFMINLCDYFFYNSDVLSYVANIEN